MLQYRVTGMSCAACVARIEKAVNKVPGVTSCAASLLTNSLSVEGEARSEDIIAAVTAAGYGAEPAASALTTSSLENDDIPQCRQRLRWSLLFLAAIVYLSMGHHMWGWPLPEWLERNPQASALLEFLLTAAVLAINRKFFISGSRSLAQGGANMDTLVALGAGSAFLWSCWVVLQMYLFSDGQQLDPHRELHFESAAMILTLITVGKLLEAKSKGRTTDALRHLLDLAPQTATLRREGKEITVPCSEIRLGDIFILRPGERVPVDGEIVSGASSLNEAALTGESLPLDKTVGDTVFAATLNVSGYLECRATRVGGDTTLAQIIKLVSEASSSKAPIARLADKVSGIFVPTVIAIAALTVLGWMMAGIPFASALSRGIAVLVISCPCSLGLATPVAIMVASGLGARSGILFKNATALEEMGRLQIVALDKTGTITEGQPRVTALATAEGISETELLRLAGALERPSEHPLAQAIQQRTAGLELPECRDFSAHSGWGVSARIEGSLLRGGNEEFIAAAATIPENLRAQAREMAQSGSTVLWFSREEQALGLIAVTDVIKPDSSAALAALHGLGLRTVMITGDGELAAKHIASQAGVDLVLSGVRPEGKEAAIRALQGLGKVAMVGDGINDAPALARADVGLAIGAGTDVAIDAAEVVLTRSTLSDVASAIRLSRATLRNIRQNLFWAFFYNALGIPLASGLFIPLLGWELSPVYGAAAMSLSSFCVVSNALRLNRIDIFSADRDSAQGTAVSLQGLEDLNLPKISPPEIAELHRVTISISGMMCGHCEATVKELLEGFSQVSSAQVSHELGTAIVSYTGELDRQAITAAIEDEDYEVIGWT